MTVRALMLLLVAALAAVALAAVPAAAQDQGSATVAPGDAPVVDILQLSGPVDPPTVAAVRDLVVAAARRGSEVVVIQLDADSGIAVTATEVVEAVRAGDVPVVVWVGPGAARAQGAGAFLWAAADVRAAASDAVLGPACPVTVSAGCSAADRALLATVLEDGELATGRVAPATAQLVVDGLEPLLVELDGVEVGGRELRVRSDEVTVRFHGLGLLRRTLHATLSPTFVYLLLVTVLGLLLFELFQPGWGVAGVAALLLAPLAGYGVAVLPVRWWALALVVVGLLLLALDLAIAGLGVPTLLGAAALAAGSLLLFAGTIGLPVWLVATVTAAAVLFFVVIMTVVLRAQAGPDVEAVGERLIGAHGVVRSTMDPEGHVFVAGALWRARRNDADGRLRSGTRVRVTGVEGAMLLVEPVDAEVPLEL